MRVKLEKRGVLGAGQVQKGGSLPRHIPILRIYVSSLPGPFSESVTYMRSCDMPSHLQGRRTVPSPRPQIDYQIYIYISVILPYMTMTRGSSHTISVSSDITCTSSEFRGVASIYAGTQLRTT